MVNRPLAALSAVSRVVPKFGFGKAWPARTVTMRPSRHPRASAEAAACTAMEASEHAPPPAAVTAAAIHRGPLAEVNAVVEFVESAATTNLPFDRRRFGPNVPPTQRRRSSLVTCEATLRMCRASPEPCGPQVRLVRGEQPLTCTPCAPSDRRPPSARAARGRSRREAPTGRRLRPRLRAPARPPRRR